MGNRVGSSVSATSTNVQFQVVNNTAHNVSVFNESLDSGSWTTALPPQILANSSVQGTAQGPSVIGNPSFTFQVAGCADKAVANVSFQRQGAATFTVGGELTGFSIKAHHFVQGTTLICTVNVNNSLSLTNDSLGDCNTATSYYITDAKWGRSIVAADDGGQGIVYHQDPTGRENGMWALEPISGEPGYFYIREQKFHLCLVAGDTYDGHIYHQEPNDRANAKWRTVSFTDVYGSKTVQLFDQKWGKAIVAGDNEDNNVYHQDPDGRSNARWALIPNYFS